MSDWKKGSDNRGWKEWLYSNLDIAMHLWTFSTYHQVTMRELKWIIYSSFTFKCNLGMTSIYFCLCTFTSLLHFSWNPWISTPWIWHYTYRYYIHKKTYLSAVLEFSVTDFPSSAVKVYWWIINSAAADCIYANLQTLLFYVQVAWISQITALTVFLAHLPSSHVTAVYFYDPSCLAGCSFHLWFIVLDV